MREDGTEVEITESERVTLEDRLSEVEEDFSGLEEKSEDERIDAKIFWLS
jgi:hypothetical protein